MSINLLEERHIFHRQLTDSHTLSINSDGVASNADKSQRLSCEVALRVARKLGAAEGVRKLDGQSAGRNFEAAVSAFVSATFPALSMLRPGHWEILNVGSSRQGQFLAQFEPYRHLRELTEAIEQNPALATVLGNSYDISPDVLVLRKPVPPQVLTESGIIIDGAASYSPLVSRHSQAPIVHAVISCKWTLRSDRAQNARSEALNLIRNRKGRTPHIVVVTGEPMPSRLASLALGTGDIDTMYHFALSELVEATRASRNAEAMKTLDNLINGQRLRDIAEDAPLTFHRGFDQVLDQDRGLDVLMEMGYDRAILSRTIEDWGTLVSPLIPWNNGGAFVTSTLGISTFIYAPFALFCWLSPLIGLIYAALGWFTPLDPKGPQKIEEEEMEDIADEVEDYMV